MVVLRETEGIWAIILAKSKVEGIWAIISDTLEIQEQEATLEQASSNEAFPHPHAEKGLALMLHLFRGPGPPKYLAHWPGKLFLVALGRLIYILWSTRMAESTARYDKSTVRLPSWLSRGASVQSLCN